MVLVILRIQSVQQVWSVTHMRTHKRNVKRDFSKRLKQSKQRSNAAVDPGSDEYHDLEHVNDLLKNDPNLRRQARYYASRYYFYRIPLTLVSLRRESESWREAGDEEDSQVSSEVANVKFTTFLAILDDAKGKWAEKAKLAREVHAYKKGRRHGLNAKMYMHLISLLD